MSRQPNDFYPTPRWITEALLKYGPYIGGTVLEPCSGDGRIASVLEDHGLEVTQNDIDSRFNAHFNFDATERLVYKTGPGKPYDWIITNPPFSRAQEILELSLEHARVGVAFHLRLTFLEPTIRRSPFHVKHNLDRLILLPRHGKSDSASTAWFVYQKPTWVKFLRSRIIFVPKEAGKREPGFMEELANEG